MTSLRIMTFNVENMMEHFDFDRRNPGLASLLDVYTDMDRSNLIRTYWNALNDENRVFTALSMKEGAPEVICLQEVDSFKALKSFHDRYLRRISGIDYPHKALIEGNDRRGINVAVLSQHPIDSMATHQSFMDEIRRPDSVSYERVFQRDCLEVRIMKDGRILPVFVCHFKSMNPTREETRPIREAEAKAIKKIIQMRFPNPDQSDWLIVGDLNDYTEVDGWPDHEHGLWPLLEGGFAVDLIKRIPSPLDRWTHFYSQGFSYLQLDYMLASPALAWKNYGAYPEIIREGLPYRAERYSGPRWPRVGYDRPKASDHCPVVMEFNY